MRSVAVVFLIISMCGFVAESSALDRKNPVKHPLSEIAKRLSDKYTEFQRETWFDENAKGKVVEVVGSVSDVSETFGTVHVELKKNKGYGEVSISCKIPDSLRAVALDAGKGDTVLCAGSFDGYVKFVGTTVYLETEIFVVGKNAVGDYIKESEALWEAAQHEAADGKDTAGTP